MSQRRRRPVEGSQLAATIATRTDQGDAVEAPAADVRRTTKPGLRLLRGDRRAHRAPAVTPAPISPKTED